MPRYVAICMYVCMYFISFPFLQYAAVCRAVPTGFRLGGGCIPKFGPPSIPGPPQCWRNGGGGEVDVIFSKTKVPEIFRKNNFFPEISKIFSEEKFIKKNFCNSSMPGPLPRKLGPPFLLFLGVLHPPRWHGPGCMISPRLHGSSAGYMGEEYLQFDSTNHLLFSLYTHVKTHKLLHVCKQVVTNLFTNCRQVVVKSLEQAVNNL